MRFKRKDPERREYETHYFFDARFTYPSVDRGWAKTEEGARAACIVKIEAERFNKAMIVNRDTGAVLHVFKRDPETGSIEREDHRYQRMLGMKKTKVERPS
jgi:hypothetical protein